MRTGALALLLLTFPASAFEVTSENSIADQAQADAAVEKGLSFLKSKLPGLKPLDHQERKYHYGDLILWVFVKAGVPATDPDFSALFKDMIGRKLATTYETALQAMILEELDRAKYQWRIAKCGQFLIDSQCPDGAWAYGDPSPAAEQMPAGDSTLDPAKLPKGVKPKVAKKIAIRKVNPGPQIGDNSNAAFAALGLKACFDSGIAIPREVLGTAEKWWRESQIPGWCYSRHEGHKPYGSMTAAGLASLAIYDSMRDPNRSWKKDKDVAAALKWVADNFSVSHHPGPFELMKFEENSFREFYFYLAAVERALMLTGTEKLGTHDWHAEGSKSLLELQREDGHWKPDGLATNGDLVETCFAILFLKRATCPLDADLKPPK
jgi:hypothetical protein